MEGTNVVILSILVLVLIVALVLYPIGDILRNLGLEPQTSVIPGSAYEVADELNSIDAPDDMISIVMLENCKGIDKSAGEWTIYACDDESMAIYLDIGDVSGYSMRVCGGWTDGKEVAQNAPNILSSVGFSGECDVNSIFLSDESDNYKVYDICGYKLYMAGGCII